MRDWIFFVCVEWMEYGTSHKIYSRFRWQIALYKHKKNFIIMNIKKEKKEENYYFDSLPMN